ncbi:MipA/OmpV family protein [Vibrio ziniensis]|uniref:MipA/OmpV family protein n=1 Tax=Vibrio ziniensis TaxID=2711221 RepID=A0A6G7CM94_9VIBR|nr:MipA/OmpV family protein [Vibrio ziniensis]QIH43168.1 MipA/OmpV family protein [Vibrio ziniensis]
MNKFYFSAFVASSLMMSVSSYAEMSQWSLGIAAAYSPAVYKDTPSNRTVIPLIGYEGDHLFLRGFSAGYRLFPMRSQQNVIFRLMYDPRTLKPEDSDNAQIRLLDKRSSTVLGGASYQLLTPVGMFETSVGTDVADTHNGLYAELAWRFPMRFGSWGVTPSIGYSYNSDKLNNHLYGVSKEEADRSGLSEFEAKWDGQYFVGAAAYWNIVDTFRLIGNVRYTNLEGKLESSPIIDGGVNTTVMIGLSYSF